MPIRKLSWTSYYWAETERDRMWKARLPAVLQDHFDLKITQERFRSTARNSAEDLIESIGRLFQPKAPYVLHVYEYGSQTEEKAFRSLSGAQMYGSAVAYELEQRVSRSHAYR